EAGPPLPAERLVLRRRVRLLDVVAEPVVVELVAGVAVLLRGPGLADDLGRTVPIGRAELGPVLGEVLVGLRPARLQDRDAESRFGEALRDPAPGSSGAHHEHVEDVLRLAL